MQNQEFSEEYYKMKYFKYRAKYEQLKEIADSRSKIQTGGIRQFFSGSKPSTPAPTGTPQPQPLEAQDSKTNPRSKENADALMGEIGAFIRKHVTNQNDLYKIIGRLEEPCSYKHLIDIVDSISNNFSNMEMNSFKNLEEARQHIAAKELDIRNDKENLKAKIKTTCSTTLGGLNSFCNLKEPRSEPSNQSPSQETKKDIKGGYTLTPDSLDDINTEF